MLIRDKTDICRSKSQKMTMNSSINTNASASASHRSKRERRNAAISKLIHTAAREDGVSLIIVLTIIFVMTTLGGIALLATMTNLSMGAKYSSWTSEYYALDREAEKKLGQLDGRLLEAESYASEYINSQYYLDNEIIPTLTGDSATDINDKAQGFIYNTWFNTVYAPSLLPVNEGGAEILDEERYNSLFIRFNSEFYERLYFYFAYRLIAKDVKNGVFAGIEVTPMMSGYAGMLENYRNDPNGMIVGIDVSDGKDEYAKHVAVSVRVTAPIFGYESRSEDIPFTANPLWMGALTARGSIMFRAGSAGNASGAGGAGGGSGGGTANGGGTASGGGITRVYGDIYAVDINEFYINQNDWATVEGNEFGIASDGAWVEIYGNVYSRGDLHVTGSGGNITVRRYPAGFSADYKKGLFGNTLYFDTSRVPVPIQRFTQIEGGEWNRQFIPFFYRDHLGGNVYCCNLSIEEGVYGASIVIENGTGQNWQNGSSTSGGSGAGGIGAGGGIDIAGSGNFNGGAGGELPGVVWTFDDVQNNGTNSRISIEGNLIGISSDAVFNDHTSSSAVINTHYDSSTIELLGAVIMPGVAFMKFNGVNDIVDEDTYFETAESISATNTAILNAYIEKPAYDPDVLYYYNRYALNTDRGISDFFLVHYESIIDKTRHIINCLSGRIPETGIVIGGALEGYTRGAVIAGDIFGEKQMFGPPGFGAIDGYNEIVNYTDNYLAYSEIKDSLETAYRSKTESFGTLGYKFGDFVKLSAILDPNGRLYQNLEGAITILTGDSALELNGELSGIVYCAAAMDGNLPILTIRGDGSFRGTIISEGDIIIEGSPKIEYDEKLISKILLRYPEIRDFFSPGEIGDVSYVRIMGVSQGMKKLVKERYNVIDWSEWQE